MVNLSLLLFLSPFFGNVLAFSSAEKRDLDLSTLVVPVTAANGRYSVNVNMVWRSSRSLFLFVCSD
jgi:hypothetical protein